MKIAESRYRAIAFAVAALAALCAYGGMFTRLCQIFSNPQEDMSHGYLVPVFSLYVLWTERKELAARAGAPSWGGFALVALSQVLLFFGSRGLQVRIEAVSFILLCIALPWALWGRRVAAACLFPALFLCFVIPLSTYLDFVTVHLRLFASSFAVGLLRGCGLDVVRHGTAIESTGAGRFAIDIAEPCSGLRSLFALMALTAAYSWYAHRTWPRRLVLFALSVPIAVLGNVTRIVTICLVASACNPDVALGFYHDYSGYVIFAVAILLMLACSDIVERAADGLARLAREGREGRGGDAGKEEPAAEEAAPAERASAERAPSRLSMPVPALCAAACAALAAALALAPPPEVCALPAVSLPADIPGYESDTISFCHSETCCQSFRGRELDRDRPGKCPACGGDLHEISLGEQTILPKDTGMQKRVYIDPSGYMFVATAVLGGVTKSSIHRPELCLPAQGFLMMNPHDFTAGKRPYRVISVMRGDTSECALAYTFFNQDGYITASHMSRILRDVWDRTALNRVDRWVMITIYAMPPRGGGFAEKPEYAIEGFLRTFEETFR